MKLSKKDIPNLITASRIPIFFITLYLIDAKMYPLAIVVFLINEFSDNLDGYLARKYNWKSTVGIFLDQNVDRFIHMGLLVFFLTRITYISVILVLLLLLRDSLLATLRIIAFSKNVTLTAPMIFKMKHVSEFLALFLSLLFLARFTEALYFINPLLTLGVILGYTNLYFYIQNFKKASKK